MRRCDAFKPAAGVSRERQLRVRPHSGTRESSEGGPYQSDLETRFFLALGIGRPAIAAARDAAARNATSIERELIAARVVKPQRYYEALARMLGLPFLDTIAPEHVIQTRNVDAALRQPRFLAVRIGRELRDVVVPTACGFADFMQRLEADPGLREKLAVAEPATIRKAVWDARADERARQAVRRLCEQKRSDSAETVVTGRQGFLAGLALCAVLAGGFFVIHSLLVGLHVLISCFFFACVVLRLAALMAYRRPVIAADDERTKGPLPVYTVVVALHDEAKVVRQLVNALKRLKWPRTLLDIKLICEADDASTIEALEGLDLPPEFEIVRVPSIGPRTKPKALDYALAGARGDFLVIYDAEDRPHPGQLREAYAVFTGSGDDLAVIQAPLVISNGRASRFSAVFAMEYAGLFRVLLPFLARHDLPIPLGGTSNHFRIDALMAVGAWDPHNVTEDADLGMRLYRRGYRGTVIARATQEDAPETLKVWMCQRTRWFKGWLQTWLVMMRAPWTLWRDMGPRGFFAFQVLIAGMLVSALGHLLLIGFIVSGVVAAADGRLLGGSSFHEALWGVDIFNFIGGYLGFIALAHKAMIAEEKSRVRWRWVWVPFYWAAMSAAAWLAVVDLVRKPFYWAKTPHSPRSATPGTAGDLKVCYDASNAARSPVSAASMSSIRSCPQNGSPSST